MKEFVLIEIVADMEGQIKPEGITSIFTLSDLFKQYTEKLSSMELPQEKNT